MKKLTKLILVALSGFVILALLQGVLAIFKAVGIADKVYTGMVLQILYAAFGIVALAIFKKAKVLTPSLKGFGAALKAGIVMVVFTVLMCIVWAADHDPVTVSTGFIVCFLIENLFVGVAEEILMRGLLQNTAIEYFGDNTVKGVQKGIILASVIFGLTHFNNLLLGHSFTSVAAQALGAIPLGIVFGAIYYRSGNNLLPVILLHALNDAGAFLHSGVLSGAEASVAMKPFSALSLVSLALYLALGLYLIRNKKIEEAIKIPKIGE